LVQQGLLQVVEDGELRNVYRHQFVRTSRQTLNSLRESDLLVQGRPKHTKWVYLISVESRVGRSGVEALDIKHLKKSVHEPWIVAFEGLHVGADLNLTHRADPILTRGWMPTL
jgi:hypothetical protein